MLGINIDDMVEAAWIWEWAGAIAPKSEIIYVNSANGVLDSLLYSIDNNIAPVLSISYGACEANFSVADRNLLASAGQQANAQGITIVAAAGNFGATDCDGEYADRQLARLGLTVDVPASLPYVTAVGGTTLYNVGNCPRNASNNVINGSALSYIPEDPVERHFGFPGGRGFAAGGGGRSVHFSKPVWQQGPGVPSDGARDLPNIRCPPRFMFPISSVRVEAASTDSARAIPRCSLLAGHPPAPIIAGIVALINQAMADLRETVNPRLYQLAIAVPGAFHDIATGGNWMPCQARTIDCPRGGLLGYSAGRGYDLATGLGSVDAFKLVNAWPSVSR